MATSGPYIVGWSILSPLGTGRHDFVDALGSGRTGRRCAPVDGRGGPAIGYPATGAPAPIVGAQGPRPRARLPLWVSATPGLVLD